MSYTAESIARLKAKAIAAYPSIKKLLRRMAQIQPQKLDKMMGILHTEEFEKIDCLECANCCKSISPAMTDSDVRRMASASKKSITDFIDTYLLLDTDGDYVFRNAPCPFLGDGNFCAIYSSRPRACREYPHTDRKRFYQILDLTAKNSKVCPAVFNIVEKLKGSLTLQK
jgi:Fe-S-cluster containining protein